MQKTNLGSCGEKLKQVFEVKFAQFVKVGIQQKKCKNRLKWPLDEERQCPCTVSV